MKALSILLLGIFVLTGCASSGKYLNEDDRFLWEGGTNAAPAQPK